MKMAAGGEDVRVAGGRAAGGRWSSRPVVVAAAAGGSWAGGARRARRMQGCATCRGGAVRHTPHAAARGRWR